ncbi:MFS transporter [Thermomonas sp.]|jgi:MFS family permease|uniref:MFS transporter n=1 Tax=Thermomonas sp. TaxID=1971895 RepID=UPI001A352D95|nr:MFS transporter [Thermomonas sp.]MBH2009382.1 MFS transporter [Xanthomonadaceae bacterium]
MSAAPAPPLQSRGFRWLLLYRICTLLSYQIVAVTVGWHIYEITGDPLALGLVGLAEVVPYFCIAPFSGYLVDHLPRRKLGAAACTLLAVNAGVLALIAAGGLSVHGIWPIYLAVAVGGIGRSFLGPVYNALFARVLARPQFGRGASLGSVVFQVGLVLGPAAGGVLVGWMGKPAAYAVGTGFALLAAVTLLATPVSEPALPQQRGPIFRSIAEGARFVAGNQIMLGAMALDMFSVLLGGAMSMLPAFIKDILHEGPEALGILRAAPAVGSIMIALWLTRHPLQRHAGRVLLLAVACFGLCTMAFALSRHLWLSTLLLVLYGVCDGVSVVMRSTIMQLVTPDEMRGRVSSINGIFVSSSNEMGAFYDGVMARLMGLVPAMIVGGFVTLGVVATTARLAPRLRRLDLRELQ